MLTIYRDDERSKGFKGTFFNQTKTNGTNKTSIWLWHGISYCFLERTQLRKDFKVNNEVNHATFEYEIVVDNGILGSIDAKWGDYQNGWDNHQFPLDFLELTQVMIHIIRNGWLGNGGLNYVFKLFESK